ncbi:hypothetical protein SEA_MOLLYMUR_8 [Gordonia phage Mollymur]|uniref:Uncharacterized protein n=1 Tax=Gordonia phage Mollymur TaxID=2590895 RepID=A0A4Y6EBM1_9CAUD|nr:hypothetical protein PQB84_gp008 [Gordonia phage Mollymur]QDF15370.1 hypothetical protein SEA_MOLLYMUR_8 [Gordonia phage Mollymur]
MTMYALPEDGSEPYELTPAPGPLPQYAMLLFDRDTNELVMQAERVEVRGVLEPQYDHHEVITDFGETIVRTDRFVSSFDVALRMRYDEKSGCIYRQTLTRAQVAALGEVLRNATVEG